MASRRFLQAASRLRVGARAASDDARIVERATRGQVEMRQFGIESFELGHRLGVHASDVHVNVLGEHGDSQFSAYSVGNIGGRPLLEFPGVKSINLEKLEYDVGHKAYEIINRKKYTAYGVANATATIVDAILFDRKAVLPVSVKDPTRECFLSIPTVVGVGGAESVLEIRPHLNYAEAQKYDATADTLEHMCAQLPPVGPMSRTDALDAGAARKEAYEEAA